MKQVYYIKTRAEIEREGNMDDLKFGRIKDFRLDVLHNPNLEVNVYIESNGFSDSYHVRHPNINEWNLPKGTLEMYFRKMSMNALPEDLFTL